MAKYRYGELHAVEYTPSGAAISADDVVILGAVGANNATVGVALKDVADGDTEEGAVAATGVFEFTKVSGAVIKAGESVNWDASASAVDDNAATAATGDVDDFGKAMQDKGNGETTIDVLITIPGTYTA